MSLRAGIDKYREATEKCASNCAAANREKQIIEYGPLVKYIAERMALRLPKSVLVDDLISAGTFGLIDAIDKFDAGRKIKFATYARHRIKGAILDELRKTDWVSRSARQEIRQIEKAIHRLHVTLMREPEDDEIADELGVSLEVYHKMLDRTQSVGFICFNEIALEGKGTDKVPHLQTSRSPIDDLERKEMKEVVAETLAGLKEKEQLVMSLYYYEEMTQKEIAEILDLTESRICQIHTQSIIKLRSRLKSYQPAASSV